MPAGARRSERLRVRIVFRGSSTPTGFDLKAGATGFARTSIDAGLAYFQQLRKNRNPDSTTKIDNHALRSLAPAKRLREDAKLPGA